MKLNKIFNQYPVYIKILFSGSIMPYMGQYYTLLYSKTKKNSSHIPWQHLTGSYQICQQSVTLLISKHFGLKNKFSFELFTIFEKYVMFRK